MKYFIVKYADTIYWVRADGDYDAISQVETELGVTIPATQATVWTEEEIPVGTALLIASRME